MNTSALGKLSNLKYHKAMDTFRTPLVSPASTDALKGGVFIVKLVVTSQFSLLSIGEWCMLIKSIQRRQVRLGLLKLVVPRILLVLCSHWSDEVHHVWQGTLSVSPICFLLVSASFHTALSRSLTLYHSVHSVRLLFDQISFALCPALYISKIFKREFRLNAHLSSLESTMTDHYEYRVGGFTFSYHSQMP